MTVLRNGQMVGTWDRGRPPRTNSYRPCWAVASNSFTRYGLPKPRPERPARRAELSSGRRLRNASLEVHEGEILGVAGLEGQGQLELFLSLYGVCRSHGSIVGRRVRRHIRSPRDALKAGIGLALVPEDRKTEGILPTLSVRENLSLPVLEKLHRYGVLRPGEERSLIPPVGAGPENRTRDDGTDGGQLVGGQPAKGRRGQVPAYGARLLLLYDLTRGVDVGTKAEIFKMVQTLADEGYGFLFYSSDVTELANVPHRVVVMFDGRVRPSSGLERSPRSNLWRRWSATNSPAEQRPAEAIISESTGISKSIGISKSTGISGPARTHKVSGGEHEGAPGPRPAVGGQRAQGLQLGEAT